MVDAPARARQGRATRGRPGARSEARASTWSTSRSKTKSEHQTQRQSASSFALAVPRREITTWSFAVQTPSRLVVEDLALVCCRSEATM